MRICLYYYNISKFPVDRFDEILVTVPEIFHSEILKYNFIKDRIYCLVGKLFVYSSYIKDHNTQNDFLENWYRDINNKPHLSNWKSFNISHSGDFVIYAEGNENNSLGVDIEKVDMDVNVHDLCSFFCIEESKAVKFSKKPEECFFRIWVRKEAILKASGIGILEGLDKFNSLPDNVIFNGRNWNIKDISFVDHSYKLSIAFPVENECREFKKLDIINYNFAKGTDGAWEFTNAI